MSFYRTIAQSPRRIIPTNYTGAEIFSKFTGTPGFPKIGSSITTSTHTPFSCLFCPFFPLSLPGASRLDWVQIEDKYLEQGLQDDDEAEEIGYYERIASALGTSRTYRLSTSSRSPSSSATSQSPYSSRSPSSSATSQSPYSSRSPSSSATSQSPYSSMAASPLPSITENSRPTSNSANPSTSFRVTLSPQTPSAVKPRPARLRAQTASSVRSFPPPTVARHLSRSHSGQRHSHAVKQVLTNTDSPPTKLPEIVVSTILQEQNQP